ncbi:hypothetical protein J41TS12_24660 [Paenibacillus antibioticophila]|uniref:WG repeat-containing protein n=1 Tax=Paenibacillus antibioticophila TaxID=1274374 RepID=A0A919XVF5_9BACL|nr:hypothetical protein J41TS12_24660 [Paenibacillus antibioticophila]
MVSQGFASVRDQKGNIVQELNGGGWYKCDCGDRFLAWGHPHFGNAYVYYATEDAIYFTSGIKWCFCICYKP